MYTQVFCVQEIGSDAMQWEYLILNLGNQAGLLKEKLNEQGREGWELAAMIGEEQGRIGIFKRSVAREANVT